MNLPDLLRSQVLEPAASLAELFHESSDQSLPRAFLLGGENPLTVRVFDQFDLRVDGLIKDSLLGTIGLLQKIPAAPPDGPQEPEERWRQWFEQRIDEAAYLRHLLAEATRVETAGARVRPYTVELVFIEREGDEHPTAGSAELGPLLRETTFLHSIGVNIWRQPLDGPGNMRRALAWLLTESQAWLHGALPPDSTGKRFQGLDLQHFRLHGSRSLTLKSEPTLHVVHGSNGSGKSSLVEALELMVTGRIERIEDAQEFANYRQILTNRFAPANSGAEITVRFENAAPQVRRLDENDIGDGGLFDPLQGDLPAASFRLNQKLADRLAMGRPEERARLLLEAFFPEKGPELEAWARAQLAFDTALAELPEKLRQELSASGGVNFTAVEQQLGWAVGETIPWPKVRAHLPLSDEQLETLEPLLTKKLLGQIREPGDIGWDQALSMAEEIDAALERLRARVPELQTTLQHAAAILETLGPVVLTARSGSERSLPELMNDWLELVAATDLLEKEQAILTTVEDARAEGHDFSGPRRPALADWKSAPAAGQHAARLEKLRQQLTTARALVGGTLAPTTKSTQHAASKATELASFHFDALDEAARLGVFGERFKHCEPALGQAVKRAFEDRSAVAVEVDGQTLLRVGDSSWASELSARLTRLTIHLPALLPPTSISNVSPGRLLASLARPGRPEWAFLRLGQLLPALRATHAAATELLKTNRNVADEFARLVGATGPFNRAINEVMALFTPARWAYEDVVATFTSEKAQQSYGFAMSDDVPSHLRLNTAQNNTFALAFFLLCARRVSANPLRLLVLDDPFQNMDELTIFTVARGLGRLLEAWREADRAATANGTPAVAQNPWQVLIVMHGEENVDRLRQEIACAVYHLPWLSPEQRSQRATSVEITSDASWLGAKKQPLPGVFQLLPG
jgi:hypothetical protein